MPFQTAVAWAQDPATPQAPQGIAAILASPLTMLVIIFAIFYFLIIRPQQKKQKEHQAMLDKLGKGDKVITTGGIHGTIVAVEESGTLSLQVDDRVKIRVARSAIAGPTND